MNSFKHLGNTVVNNPNFAKQDINIKRAVYVTKNIEINQEFYFSFPETRLNINKIYNAYHTRAPLWDLFSEEVGKFETSYNKNIKILYDLPIDTHRNLIEPISGTRHMKIVLQKRLLSFITQIKKSTKQLPKQMYNLVRDDVRSTTGKSLRGILLQTNKVHVEQLNTSDHHLLKYHPLPDEEKWKVGVISEIIQARNNKLEVHGFTNAELVEILNHLCSD